MTLISEKVRVCNLPKQWVPAYYDLAGTTNAASAAEQMHIPGFGTTKISQVKNVTLTRGNSPVQNVYRILMPAAAAGLPQNTKVYFEVDVETTNREFRLARPEYEFGQTLRYQIAVSGSEAASDLAAKLVATVNSQSERERDFLISAAVANSSAVTLTVQQPEGYSKFFRGTFIDSVKVLNAEGDTSTDVVPTVTETTAAHRGINYGSDVEFAEKMQGNNLTQAYYFDNQEVPEEDELYAMIAWDIEISRPHPKDVTLGDKLRHVVYFKESNSTLDTRFDAMADFFLTNAATRANYESVVVGCIEASASASISAASTPIVGNYTEFAFDSTITDGQGTDVAAAFKTNA